MTTTSLSYKTRFETHITAVQECLEEILTPQEPEVLWAAMRHGVLNGGKRIRPVLLIESCVACGGTQQKALPTACALELIHCYSLIHDDLPCMDNDDLRRGLPTVHKAFSEDMAVLAGDALLALAFGVIPDNTLDVPDKVLLQVITELSQAASIKGLVNGQADDILFANDLPDEERLYRIHSGKTGALFRFSTWAGAKLAEQPEPVVSLLAKYGETLGLAFQIVDDLLDVQGNNALLGKTLGKDEAQGKITFPAVYGIAGTETILKSHIETLYSILDALPTTIQTKNLRFLVEFVQQREF